jgi:flavodoxin
MDRKKRLVAYFSASGQTKKLAQTLAEAVEGDLYEIIPETPYTSADLNWNDPGSRSSVEMKDPSYRPAIAGEVKDMEQYDTILLGFPIWWYEAPRVIQTFLEHYDFSGKTVAAFATSGGSGMGKTEHILQKSAPTATWKAGRRMSANTSLSEASAWVKSLGL